MPKPVIPVVVAALALGLWSADAAADYRGPTAQGNLTVAQILSKPQDDAAIVLRGNIVRKLASERYLFSDGTGEIEIEIEHEKRVFPEQPVDEKTRVEISGEIDKDFRKPPEIDVDSMRIIEP